MKTFKITKAKKALLFCGYPNVKTIIKDIILVAMIGVVYNAALRDHLGLDNKTTNTTETTDNSAVELTYTLEYPEPPTPEKSEVFKSCIDTGFIQLASAEARSPEKVESEQKKEVRELFDPSDDTVDMVTHATKEEIEILIDMIIESRWYETDHEHPLYKCAGEFVEAEEKYGVSATMMLAIVTWESGFCDIYGGFGYDNMQANNIAGIMDGYSPKKFDSVNDCIDALGALLKSYIDEYNADSVESVCRRYCCGSKRWTRCIRATTLDYNEWLYDIMLDNNKLTAGEKT